MGFTARKSFKVAPGVRMTVSKRGLSTSVGTRGARVTASTSGRVTRTVGVPGTGVRYTTSSSRRTPAQTSSHQTAPAQSPLPVKPGLFAPRWEKDLFRAIQTNDASALPTIAAASAEAAPIASVIEALWAFSSGNNKRARDLLTWYWGRGDNIEDNQFFRKYIGRSLLSIGIAPGVTAELPLGRDAIGLALAELHQDAGDLEGAISVVESLDPSAVAAVSLAELYVATKRYDDVVDVTNGIKNEDDATALLMTYRGIAHREQGHHEASREALKEALKSSKRDEAIRQLALFERSQTYEAEGKRAMARKDVERILAMDANYPGLDEALERLR